MRNLPHLGLIGAAALIAVAAANDTRNAKEQLPEPIDARVEGNVVRPERLRFDQSLVHQLNVPQGFVVNTFATGIENARMMAIGPDGAIFVTRPEKNEVMVLEDTNGDGVADRRWTAVVKLPYVHGVTVHNNRLYLATPTQVWAADIRADGGLREPEILIRNLPDGAQHPNRTIAVGPDGMLYISLGSSCNACDETNPEHATLIRASLDGKQREIFARGLRNTVGFGWHPETGELWGMDHGSDWRGDAIPPEELNQIREGGHYGWPFCYGDRVVDELTIGTPPNGQTRREFCGQTMPMTMGYTAHAAPMGMVFYNAAQFPPEYVGDAFVAMRGFWNRRPPVGYSVVRVRFQGGQPAGFEDFLTGFLAGNAEAYLGRPVGIVVARDGSLLVSDDTNGVIYRVSYQGDPRPVSSATAPAR